ncbi:hypothetical protein ALO94_201006 [Pseudomonas syringae pv. spinaceae]|uniref:Uncharacterized protein n=1 Tax=Pseudomonas syringae pv. spinaceae TaxID=264459 RepID=A0A0Q0HBA7_PSESX|nr:hypothetical protein ALO94_201006 [Pseudomonas syringae pv. spinaceae]
MILEVALQQQVCRLKTNAPRRGSRQIAYIHAEEITPGRQHVQSPAAGCAAGACRYEAAAQRIKHSLHFAGAAGVQPWRDHLAQVVKNQRQVIVYGYVVQLFTRHHTLDQRRSIKLKPFAGIPGSAPRVCADREQRDRTFAGPRLGQLAVERIKAQCKGLAQRPQQTRLRPAPVATRDAQQGQQCVGAQATFR